MNELFYAKVIDNDSSNNLLNPVTDGSVQIYIERLHHGFSASEYPWAKQDREWSSDIPEIGDNIWVWFEDERYWKQPYYRNEVDLKDIHHHMDFTDVKTNTGMLSSYPDIKFKILKNGVCLGMSSDDSNPEIVLYNPAGTKKSFVFLDGSGNIYLKNSSGYILLKDDGEININDHFIVEA